MEVFTDEYFMKEALKEAQKAYDADEVPIGAIIVYDNKIIARAHNLTERLNDVTAHAEMQAITSAANYIGGKYVTESDPFSEKLKTRSDEKNNYCFIASDYKQRLRANIMLFQTQLNRNIRHAYKR